MAEITIGISMVDIRVSKENNDFNKREQTTSFPNAQAKSYSQSQPLFLILHLSSNVQVQ